MVSMELCAGGIKNETACALANIGRVLEVAGSGLDQVLSCTAFLADLESDYDDMNDAYTAVFSKDPPARAAFGAAAIAMGAKAEFSCIAAV